MKADRRHSVTKRPPTMTPNQIGMLSFAAAIALAVLIELGARALGG